MTDDHDSGTDIFDEAAGQLAREVSAELVRPLRGLRETLALAVEKLDRHMGAARGPVGLSWNEVDRLRQQLADAYLQCRALTRLASELAEVVRDSPGRVEAIDLNKLVDHSLNLVRHKFAPHTEVLVDHGALPLARGAPRLLSLALVATMTAAAESAAATEGGHVSITTRREPGAADQVSVRITGEGPGAPAAVELAVAIAAEAAQSSGGSFELDPAFSRGCAFELRLITGR